MSTTDTRTEADAGRSDAAAPPPRNRPIGKSPATIAWLMLVPAGVLLVTFLIIPIILTFILAFTNARLISPQPATFVGVDNFVRLFSDETFWASLRNTVDLRRGDRARTVGRRARAGGAGQHEDPRRQLLPHDLLPARGHLHRGGLHAVAVHVPARRSDQLRAGPLQHPRPGLAGQPEDRPVRHHRVVHLAGVRHAHGHLAVRTANHSRRAVRGRRDRRRQQVAAVRPRHLAGPATRRRCSS